MALGRVTNHCKILEFSQPPRTNFHPLGNNITRAENAYPTLKPVCEPGFKTTLVGSKIPRNTLPPLCLKSLLQQFILLCSSFSIFILSLF